MVAPVVGLIVHHAIPLTGGNTRIVFGSRRDNLVEGRLCLLGVGKCQIALTGTGIEETLTGTQVLDVHITTADNGIFYKLVEGILKGCGNALLERLHLADQLLVLFDALLYLLVGEIEVAEVHMFGLGSDTQAVILHLDFLNGIGIVLAEGTGCPVA